MILRLLDNAGNNVRLLAYVFTEWDPQLDWLKHNESNRAYWQDS